MSNDLKNVPLVTSKEFDDFLKENDWIKKEMTDIINEFESKDSNASEKNSDDKNNSKKNSIVEFSKKNPELIIAALLGISTYITYKFCSMLITNAVFKGNLKTHKYLNKD